MPLRPARPEDIPAMHRVRVAVRENALSSPGRITAADYQEALAHGRGWVALDDDSPGGPDHPEPPIVGFAFGLLDGNVWALFVDPDHEGRGHGAALHDAMLAWLEAHAARPIWLTTGLGTRAEAFYRARGWLDRGLTPAGNERRFERA